jgi:aspartate aminotransferase
MKTDLTTQSALEPRLREMSMSATLAIVERCRQRAAQGMSVAQLGLGQSPFPVPDSVVAALRNAATEKEYLPVRGLGELRDEVASYHRRRHAIARTGGDVIIAPGSKELMFLLQVAFAGELLVPAPAWVSYVPQARIAGRSVRTVPTSAENKYRLSPTDLDAACHPARGRPRILILNYPSNPTGLSYSEAELAELAEVARHHGIVVLSDEIYGELDHAGRHASIARFLEDATIVSSGLSKWCGAGGWRLGTFSFPPRLRWLLDAIAVLASETYSATCAPVQHAAVRAFRGGTDIEDYLVRSRKILAALAEAACARLVEAGADVSTPDGAFYLFPGFTAHADALARRGITDDRVLAESLFAETGVATLPGSSFGIDPSALRLRLALVDFDGARALAAARAEAVDRAFVERHCSTTLRGVTELAAFVAGS